MNPAIQFDQEFSDFRLEVLPQVLNQKWLILEKLFFFLKKKKNNFVKIWQKPPPPGGGFLANFVKIWQKPPPRGGFLANFSFCDKPQFIEVLMATIVLKPERVKCSLRFIFSTILINNFKSARFFVIIGNLLKWIMTVSISFNDCTRSWTAFSPCLVTCPTPKDLLIYSKSGLSLKWRHISKLGLTLHPCLYFWSSVIEQVKQPSPSAKPVTKFGSSLESPFKEELI